MNLCPICEHTVGLWCNAIPFDDGRIYHVACYPQQELVDELHIAHMVRGGLIWENNGKRVKTSSPYAIANSRLEARAPGLCPHMSRQVTFPGGSKFVSKLCVGKRCELMKQRRCGPKTHVHHGHGDYILIELEEKPDQKYVDEIQDAFKDTGITPLITVPMERQDPVHPHMPLPLVHQKEKED